MQPGEEPFHFPAPKVAAQFPSILAFASALPVRGDQFDVVFFGELLVERVRVVSLVADEPGGQLVEETSGKNLFHKLALGWRSAPRECHQIGFQLFMRLARVLSLVA